LNVNGKPCRSICLADDGWSVNIIDQTFLPHEFLWRRLTTPQEAAEAIRFMRVRGAPLIGATAAYGMALAMRTNAGDDNLAAQYQMLLATRPTAVNLRWALQRMRTLLQELPVGQRAESAYLEAARLCDEDVEINRRIGENGLQVFKEVAARKSGNTLNVLTHCNAGWLATVDWGTALAPMYMAHDSGINIHVWVDETRPRNQGAALTAWELAAHGIPHDVIVDNAGGHLMQHGEVDLCITGTDRTTRSGDVCNKIGTYLKALAAHDNGVPFYVALPGPTIDWTLRDGLADIPIEERDAEEVTRVSGINQKGELQSVAITAAHISARNFAFDVTPARLVTGLVTERGVCAASEAGLLGLYPEMGTPNIK
jgi:methylthioribose-1-phosphate isomerase